MPRSLISSGSTVYGVITPSNPSNIYTDVVRQLVGYLPQKSVIGTGEFNAICWHVTVDMGGWNDVRLGARDDSTAKSYVNGAFKDLAINQRTACCAVNVYNGNSLAVFTKSLDHASHVLQDGSMVW